MKQLFCFSVALVVLAAALPSYAFESDSAPPAITEEERALLEAKKKQKSPFGAIVGFYQALGGGTLVADPNVRRSSYDLSLDMKPFWKITPLMRLAVRLVVSQSIVENYDSVVTRKNRILLSDTEVSFQHLKFYTIPGAKINIGGVAMLLAPTSPQSQYRDMYTSAKGLLSFSRAFGKVYLRYRVQGFKNFNRAEAATMNIEDVGEHVVLTHFNGAEQLTSDVVTAGSANVSFGVVQDWLVAWNVTEELSLAAIFLLNNSWTYSSFPKDELSSEFAVSGRGQRDTMRGILDVTYQFHKNLSVSVGTDTLVVPKTADNKDFIFPFANFSNNHRNNTAIYLGLNGTF